MEENALIMNTKQTMLTIGVMVLVTIVAVASMLFLLHPHTQLTCASFKSREAMEAAHLEGCTAYPYYNDDVAAQTEK